MLPATGWCLLLHATSYLLRVICHLRLLHASSDDAGNGNNHGRNTSFMQCIFDVQDTSGYKLLFGYYDTNGTTIMRGNSAHNENSYTFIRLGDT